MALLKYCNDEKTIDLTVGDLILFKSEQAKKDYPFFGKVHEIPNPESESSKELMVSPSIRLIVDEEFGRTPMPRYKRAESDPAQYRAHLITDMWTGTSEYIAGILRTNFQYMDPWADAIRKMKPPYDLKPLEKRVS